MISKQLMFLLRLFQFFGFFCHVPQQCVKLLLLRVGQTKATQKLRNATQWLQKEKLFYWTQMDNFVAIKEAKQENWPPA